VSPLRSGKRTPESSQGMEAGHLVCFQFSNPREYQVLMRGVEEKRGEIGDLNDASIGFQDGLTQAVDVFDDLLVCGGDGHLASLLKHVEDQGSISLEIHFNGHGNIRKHG
jgi:hypothetical protein